MVEHVARVLCLAAASEIRGVGCSFCEDEECSMWPSFVREARASIEAVRDHVRLDRRGKPRKRSATEIVATL